MYLDESLTLGIASPHLDLAQDDPVIEAWTLGSDCSSVYSHAVKAARLHCDVP